MDRTKINDGVTQSWNKIVYTPCKNFNFEQDEKSLNIQDLAAIKNL